MNTQPTKIFIAILFFMLVDWGIDLIREQIGSNEFKNWFKKLW